MRRLRRLPILFQCVRRQPKQRRLIFRLRRMRLPPSLRYQAASASAAPQQRLGISKSPAFFQSKEQALPHSQMALISQTDVLHIEVLVFQQPETEVSHSEKQALLYAKHPSAR